MSADTTVIVTSITTPVVVGVTYAGPAGTTDHGALSGLGDNDHGDIYYTEAEIDAALAALDHGDLAGLADDDHTQYHTDARGDARYYTETELDAGQLDNRYFTETEHLDSSAGAGDAGKPVKLDAGGHIDASMVNDGDIDHGSVGGLLDNDHTQYLLHTLGTLTDVRETFYQDASATGSVELDAGNGNHQEWNLTGNLTGQTFAGFTNGKSQTVVLDIIPNGFTVAYDAALDFGSAGAPSTPADGSWLRLVLTTTDGGTSFTAVCPDAGFSE